MTLIDMLNEQYREGKQWTKDIALDMLLNYDTTPQQRQDLQQWLDTMLRQLRIDHLQRIHNTMELADVEQDK